MKINQSSTIKFISITATKTNVRTYVGTTKRGQVSVFMGYRVNTADIIRYKCVDE